MAHCTCLLNLSLSSRGLNSEICRVPIATATPPGIHGRHALPTEAFLATDMHAKREAATKAHSLAIGGSPSPVTSLAVKIQTYAVGTGKSSPGI